MTPEEKLYKAIARVKQNVSSPQPEGAIIVAAYRAGELPDTETCLYVMAELLKAEGKE